MPAPSATLLTPQPNLDQALVEPGSSALSVLWRNYFRRLDTMFRKAQYGPLVNAVDDAAAAAAGVEVNGLYRNGNAVQIRLV